ncbi:MAG: hypothetical protein ACRD68_09315, partial [Pyrinomonadaceae bacterium]
MTILALSLILLTAQGTPAPRAEALVERMEHAAALIRDNRIEEAERQLNYVLKVAPREAAALNLMGTIRARQGRLDEA